MNSSTPNDTFNPEDHFKYPKYYAPVDPQLNDQRHYLRIDRMPIVTNGMVVASCVQIYLDQDGSVKEKFMDGAWNSNLWREITRDEAFDIIYNEVP